jgi:hypothetical protein
MWVQSKSNNNDNKAINMDQVEYCYKGFYTGYQDEKKHSIVFKYTRTETTWEYDSEEERDMAFDNLRSVVKVVTVI